MKSGAGVDIAPAGARRRSTDTVVVDMSERYSTISFFSDYGLVDEFVGVVHSVIRTIAPDATVIDLSHEVAAHDVRAGGLLLARSAQYLCPGIVLGVVDPGVGTNRRGVALEVGDGESVLVGPDNGLFAPAVAMVGGVTRAVELTNADYQLPAPGATFDGRDVFAPAAAHLCRGVDIGELGPEVATESLMPGVLPVLRTEGDTVIAEVLWIDRFGNAQLNLDPEDLTDKGAWFQLRVGDESRRVRLTTAYGELAHGELGLVVDSYGLVSLAVPHGSAASDLRLGAPAEVTLEATDAPRGESSPVTLRTRGRS